MVAAQLGADLAAGVVEAQLVAARATDLAGAGAGQVPVAGMALILGIDRFMSECRALTNFVGNAVATIVVARWENELDEAQLARVLSGHAVNPAADPVLRPAE